MTATASCVVLSASQYRPSNCQCGTYSPFLSFQRLFSDWECLLCPLLISIMHECHHTGRQHSIGPQWELQVKNTEVLGGSAADSATGQRYSSLCTAKVSLVWPGHKMKKAPSG